MKPFEEQNHYEILDISPDVTPFEIRHAYRTALQTYENGSLATYSFFSEDERNKVLARLEEAFSTLINEETRSEYDRMLIKLGVIEEKSRYKKAARKPIPIFDLKHTKATASTTSAISEKLKSKATAGQIFNEILAQDVLTGMDLKKMRIELGLSLEEIADQTKVQISLLRCIEEDLFDQLPSMFHLRSFLKSYVQCLHIDTESVINRYMKRFKD